MSNSINPIEAIEALYKGTRSLQAGADLHDGFRNCREVAVAAFVKLSNDIIAAKNGHGETSPVVVETAPAEAPPEADDSQS